MDQKNVCGTLEMTGNGGGRIRMPKANYAARGGDPIVSPSACQALRLRGGESVEARPTGKRKGPAPVIEKKNVVSVDGMPPEDRAECTPFEDLIPIDPQRAVRFEIPDGSTSMRIVDLMTPIGFGQRGLIVAPPRTGKTVLLQQMAAGVATNHPETYMMVLLIDERPEEVTDMRRTVRGEVVASSNDHDVASHTRIARLMIEKARRMVETGQDVVILLDSLTRLGRAFNANIGGSRRIMSGGLDSRALIEPKGIFGAARNIEDGGSLTIIASCLIETGSRMDDVIFNEFKGTGNMEIMLSREMANRRIWPAIDLNASGTRKEELLLSPAALDVSHRLRRKLMDLGPVRAMETLLDALNRYETTDSFITAMAT